MSCQMCYCSSVNNSPRFSHDLRAHLCGLIRMEVGVYTAVRAFDAATKVIDGPSSLPHSEERRMRMERVISGMHLLSSPIK